jgi:hypothetical protein
MINGCPTSQFIFQAYNHSHSKAIVIGHGPGGGFFWESDWPDACFFPQLVGGVNHYEAIFLTG